MSRKDYKAFADVFADRVRIARNIDNTAARLAHYREIAEDMCVVFARDNANFKRDRFLDACGFTS